MLEPDRIGPESSSRHSRYRATPNACCSFLSPVWLSCACGIRGGRPGTVLRRSRATHGGVIVVNCVKAGNGLKNVLLPGINASISFAPNRPYALGPEYMVRRTDERYRLVPAKLVDPKFLSFSSLICQG
jgi:hypothetical protein